MFKNLKKSKTRFLQKFGYIYKLTLQIEQFRTSLSVQQLRLHTSSAAGIGSIPGQGTKIWQVSWYRQEKKKSF